MGGEPDLDLTEAFVETMVERAKDMSRRAYAPYSKFHVGACLLTEGGRLIDGCNVENASYGLTICAERNAVFQMFAVPAEDETAISSRDTEIRAVVIYTPTPTPSAPCGACRQVLNEFGTENTYVLSVCDGPDRLETTLGQLLPHAFGPKNLE